MLVSRMAFVAALIVSAALFSYSLIGIAAAGGDLRSAVREQPSERAAPVADERCADEHDDRVRL